jgi:exopolyphosphatase/guanosine-5'-triphosphate,3'-diphosphate pyrophosphatase
VLCGLGRHRRPASSATTQSIALWRRWRFAHRPHPAVKNVRAFATAAVRGRDGAAFIARAEKACGLRIEVLSGEKAARRPGIMMSFVEPDGAPAISAAAA